MEFVIGREFKDTEETSDARRVDHLPLWQALRNNHTASEWMAAKLKLEPHQVHITKTSIAEDKKVLLEGVANLDGDILKLSMTVDGEKPFQTNS